MAARSLAVRSQFIAAPAKFTAQRKSGLLAAASRLLMPPKELPMTPIWPSWISGRPRANARAATTSSLSRSSRATSCSS